MMKRKVSILTLTFLFFASTTGLPVTLHYCKMMESVSSEVCEMHNVKVEKSCCGSESTSYPIKLTSENSPCCLDELIYNKVDDEFLFNKSTVSPSFSSEILLQPVAIISDAENLNLNESYYTDSSPPFLINPYLHITNSVLLI